MTGSARRRSLAVGAAGGVRAVSIASLRPSRQNPRGIARRFVILWLAAAIGAVSLALGWQRLTHKERRSVDSELIQAADDGDSPQIAALLRRAPGSMPRIPMARPP
jgi:hypothetical protein